MSTAGKVALAVLGTLAAFVVIGTLSRSGDAPTDVGPTHSNNAAASTGTPSAKPTEPKGYSDGVYEVGVDIPPGKYKTSGPNADGGLPECYYARYRGDSTEFGNLIDNGISKGIQTMTVKPTDKILELSGDCTWQKVG